MIRHFIVTSKDGVEFSTQIYADSALSAALSQDRVTDYAATKTSIALGDNEAYTRCAVQPLTPRVNLKLIQGGLSAKEYDSIESLLDDTELVLI